MLDNEELKRAVEILVKHFNPRLIILFGSQARGDWKPWSDYDLLIIADFKEKYLDRIGSILEALSDIHIPIEPHPYTFEEAVNMLLKGNILIIDALEGGRVLYQRSRSDLERLLKILSDLKRRGLKRTHTSIILPSNQE